MQNPPYHLHNDLIYIWGQWHMHFVQWITWDEEECRTASFYKNMQELLDKRLSEILCPVAYSFKNKVSVGNMRHKLTAKTFVKIYCTLKKWPLRKEGGIL